MAADNRLLGEFNLEGIPPAPMGVPQIEVSFNIDANGILQVSAKDKGTGKEQTVKIESSGGLSKDEIDRMQRDAQAHAAEDKQRRELAEARNAAEQRVYQLEKLLNENKGRLSESDTAAVRGAIDRSTKRSRGTTRPRSSGRSTTSSRPARQCPSTSMPRRRPRPGTGRPPTAPRVRRTEAGTAAQADEVIDVEFDEKK